MNDQQQELFEQKFAERIARGFPYCGKNSIAVYRKYVIAFIENFSGGRVSDSAFDIILKELLASGDLKPIVFDDKSSEIEKKIADFES